MKHTIEVRSLDFSGTLKTLDALVVPKGATEVEFDFGHLGTVEPFGMLVISRAIQILRADHLGLRFYAINHEGVNCSYAAHFGFFRNFGLQFGKAPGDARGNNNYIPITSCSIGDLADEAESHGDSVGNLLVAQAASLARVLARGDGRLCTILTYSIREMLRNVVDHSRAASYEFCAQFWPQKMRVEVAVVDRGEGVLRSLSANPNLKLRSHLEALKWSVLPGISGKMFKGIYVDKSNPFQNSGFGLFITSRICSGHGSFAIGSYDSLLKIQNRTTQDLRFGYQGTAVRLVLDTDNLPDDAEAELNKLVQEGESLAEDLPEAFKVPNSASKLIRGEFTRGTF